MAVIGIESSAHTLGVGVVERGKVLANEMRMFPITDEGIIPMKVAEFHAKNVRPIIQAAVKKAGISLSDIKGIGYTKGPGLGPCLNVGALAAKSLSQRYSIPIFPVNHAVAHLEIAKRTNRFKDPIALYVSGGNSQIIGMDERPYRHYHVYGETFDIGVGNMLDNFARKAKLVPSWGSTVARVAEGGSYIEMPYTVKGMDFTFTGLLTNAVSLLGKQKLPDIAFSMQETAFAMLCEATERALMLTSKRELTVCGGVAQSRRLREMLLSICKAHGIKFGFAENQYNADNGAMIAMVAELMQASGERHAVASCGINQKYRVDSVKVTWK